MYEKEIRLLEEMDSNNNPDQSSNDSQQQQISQLDDNHKLFSAVVSDVIQ